MSSSDIIIRRMTERDLDAVAGIERRTFPRPWAREVFAKDLGQNPAARWLVAERDDAVIGFIGTWIIIDESEITNFAVAEEARRQGVGRRLLSAALQYLSNLGASCCTLEVRAGNEPAKALYTSLGFIRVGLRKKYYEDNGEDAWLMLCQHLPEADPDFEEEETIHLPPSGQ